jgi:hypothetical protein
MLGIGKQSETLKKQLMDEILEIRADRKSRDVLVDGTFEKFTN